MRQKLGNPGDGMLGDAGENVFEARRKDRLHALTRKPRNSASPRRSCACITAKEHSVIAAHCYAADRALGRVVVVLEISALALAERGAALQGVA